MKVGPSISRDRESFPKHINLTFVYIHIADEEPAQQAYLHIITLRNTRWLH